MSKGQIVQVIGAVVDVEFDRDALPLVTRDSQRRALSGALVDGALARLADLPEGKAREALLSELRELASRQDLAKDEKVKENHRAWRMVRLRAVLEYREAFASALGASSG